MSSSFWNNSQITIARTVDDLVTIIQEKRSRSTAVGCSQVKFIKSLLVAISGIDGSGKGYVTEKIAQETNKQGLILTDFVVGENLLCRLIENLPENGVSADELSWKTGACYLVLLESIS